jgi:hypothetical protein
MSRDQQPDESRGPDPSDEPTTGPPAGAFSASGPHPTGVPYGSAAAGSSPPGGRGAAGGPDTSGDRSAAGRPDTSGDRSAAAGPDTSGDESTAVGRERARTRAGGARSTRPAGDGALPGKAPGKADTPAEAEARKRRKRRLFIAGISLAAAIVVIALCAGGLAALRAVTGFRDDAADSRDDRRLRDSACLELEDRLNRLVPPGATTTPQTRAVAVRNENAAARIYVGRLGDQRVADGWRELLDARTSYAEALDAQAKSRTAAFYVAPVPRDGVSLADQLARWSPDACAGPIRRLAAPDL